MLFQLGAVTFEVFPLNVDKATREVGADYAAKDVIGAPKPREFTGEADETVELSGTLWPSKFGGLSTFEALQDIARTGEPQPLVRGDGAFYGWFLIDKVKEESTYLDARGVGRKIAFSASLTRSPRAASASGAMSTLMGLFA